MRRTGVRRLVVVSATSFHTEGDGPFTRAVVKPILGRVLRNSIVDMSGMEASVRGSGVEWTIVCPPRLTNGRGRGRYRLQLDRNVPAGLRISRADLARAVLDCLEHPESSRRWVSVAA